MFFVSEIKTSTPESFETELQKQVYAAFDELGISFERVDTDEAVTMDDCVDIDRRLCMKMVKTLFLCNRQKTEFYLFVTSGDKKFRSADFSTAMETSRVSFAPAELMKTMLGTKIGAATVLSCINDSDKKVKIVVDKCVADSDSYGCSDGTTTSYLKLKTDDVLLKFLVHFGHKASVIDL